MKIAAMQQAVSSTFKLTDADPPAEAEDIVLLGQFLKSWSISDEEMLRSERLLVSRSFVDTNRDIPSKVPAVDFELLLGELLADGAQRCKRKLRKGSNRDGIEHPRTFWAMTTSKHGSLSGPSSGKKGIEVLHRLGRCYMWPCVDFLKFEYAGTTFPDPHLYETVCKWCAKSNDFRDAEGSSVTSTSSSSEDWWLLRFEELSDSRLGELLKNKRSPLSRDLKSQFGSKCMGDFCGEPRGLSL